MDYSSPYRPPQDVESQQDDAFIGAGFRLSPHVQNDTGRLAKYMGDVGGVLILIAVLSAFSVIAMIAMVRDMPNAGGTLQSVIQVGQQLANVIFLFLIGLYMRRASKPFKEIAKTPDGHAPNLRAGMTTLKTMYGIQCVFVAFGIVVLVLTQLAMLWGMS